MKNELQKLKRLLKKELELEEKMKRLKQRKSELKQEFLEIMKTDTFSNKFVSIQKRKKYQIKEVDKEKAKQFYEIKEVLNKSNVIEYYRAFKKVDGIEIKESDQIIFRKKKGGLE